MSLLFEINTSHLLDKSSAAESKMMPFKKCIVIVVYEDRNRL